MDAWDWTQGELTDQVRGCRERQRRECQARSIIAARQAEYFGLLLSGKGSQAPEVYELFPFWSEKEKETLKLAHYRKLMERLAGGGGTHAR